MVEPAEINVLIADVLVDLLDSATIFRSVTRRPKTIFALQDYLTTYLLRRTTPDVRTKIWDDQILSHIIWRMLIGYPNHRISEDHLSRTFLLSEGKLECKYYANRKSILDFINNKSDKWWTRLSKVWMKKIGNYIERFVVKHSAIQKQRKGLDQLLLPDDINIQIMKYLIGPVTAATLYVR
jgi:hypothetical protein